MNDIDILKQKIAELEAEIQAVKNGGFEYVGMETIKNNIFETTKTAAAGGTPIYTTYSYSGVGAFGWSSTNAPDKVLVLNIGGKRYWIPAFNPS